MVNSKDGVVLPCCLPYGKAGGLQIPCCQRIKVTDYNFTLDALALKPSDFCNVRVKLTLHQVMKLYAIYMSPEHLEGTVPGTKADDRGYNQLSHSEVDACLNVSRLVRSENKGCEL